MANRFTDTGKWGDKDFSKFSLHAKVVYLYLIDNCNNAGFYELNESLMSFQIGIPEEKIIEAVRELGKKCVVIDGFLWIKSFIKRQGNFILNPDNNAHKQIVSQLKEQMGRFSISGEFSQFLEGLTEKTREILGAKEGLFSPPVMVMSCNGTPPVFESSLKGGQGENFLSVSEIAPEESPSALTTGGFLELQENYRQLISPDRELVGFQRGKFNQLFQGYGEEKLRHALNVCHEEGWKSFTSLKDFLDGKLKRKAERFLQTNQNGKKYGDKFTDDELKAKRDKLAATLKAEFGR